MNQEDAIENISKLMDTCHRCEQLLDHTVSLPPGSLLHQTAARIRDVVGRFAFELRAEIQRIDSGGPIPGLEEIVHSAVGDDVWNVCRRHLDQVLQHYGEVLSTALPPHARAMISRQQSEIARFCQEIPESGYPV